MPGRVFPWDQDHAPIVRTRRRHPSPHEVCPGLHRSARVNSAAVSRLCDMLGLAVVPGGDVDRQPRDDGGAILAGGALEAHCRSALSARASGVRRAPRSSLITMLAASWRYAAQTRRASAAVWAFLRSRPVGPVHVTVNDITRLHKSGEADRRPHAAAALGEHRPTSTPRLGNRR